MYPGETIAGAVSLVCIYLCVFFVRRLNEKDAKFSATAFGVLSVIFIILFVVLFTTNRTNAKNDREAKAQIEKRDHVQVRELSTDKLTIRFIRDGRVCDGSLKPFEGNFLLADDEVCAEVPGQ